MEKQLYPILYKIEKKHWWFCSRRKIIGSFVKNIAKPEVFSILDVGCSIGITMKYLEQYGKVEGVDASKDAVEYCRLQKLSCCEGEATKLPFPDNSFDLVCALDLLEHIVNAKDGVDEFYRVLKNGGYLLITVPAFNSLWSDFDIVSHHFKRFTAKELKKLVEASNLSILKISYLNFFLFPCFLIFRFFKISKIYSELSVPPFNKVFEFIFSSEKTFLKYINFPWGSSIFVLARKAVRQKC